MKRIDIVWLGKTLGTASGWDGEPGESWWAYDFKPSEGVELPECPSLQFEESSGKVIAQDSEGNDLHVWTVIWTLQEDVK